MTKDAGGKGYHCAKCGMLTGFLGCPHCYPKKYVKGLRDMGWKGKLSDLVDRKTGHYITPDRICQKGCCWR